MRLDCDTSLTIGYKSQPQISRVLSEAWLRKNGYCLACESDRLLQTPANTKASDFICRECNERYELKAFQALPTRRLVDGAYGALISRIQSESVPNLLLLQRSEQWQILGLIAVHHLFLTPEVVEKRKPLSLTARRAGWVGCNIRLDLIAGDAQIPVVQGGVPSNPAVVREQFKRFQGLGSIPASSRGWTTFTLKVIRELNSASFCLKDVYSLESRFALMYPKNLNVRAKIRQQLQVLRDLGHLRFRGNGKYDLVV